MAPAWVLERRGPHVSLQVEVSCLCGKAANMWGIIMLQLDFWPSTIIAGAHLEHASCMQLGMLSAIFAVAV